MKPLSGQSPACVIKFVTVKLLLKQAGKEEKKKLYGFLHGAGTKILESGSKQHYETF